MGSTPFDAYRSIQRKLIDDPDSISWTSPHKVCVLKGITGKLGIKVKVYEGKSSVETYSIITKVKEECRLLKGQSLSEFERIVSINGVHIQNYVEDCVLSLLQSNESVIELIVCRIDLKRDRDSSSSTDSAEMSSRPPLMKIKPLKPGEECDNLLSPNSAHSITDSTFPGQFLEPERNVSLPVKSSSKEVNNVSEHYPSVELLRKSKRGTDSGKLSPGTAETYLKYPHGVKWSTTKTIILDRGSQPNFGFKFKIKKCVYRQDDWYTLVVEVKEPPAEGKLMIGDYIRSINGQALATPQEAFKMMESLEQCSSARIVLQRPEGLIPNFKGKISLPKDPGTCSSKGLPGSPTICEPVDIKPKRQNSCTSGGSGKLFPSEIHPSKPEVVKPATKYRQPDNSTLVSGLFNVVRPESRCSSSNESHMNFLTNEKLVDNSDVHLIVQEPPILNNNNQVLSEFQTNRTVKLPKIRIFICGNEARLLAKLLIPASFLKTESNTAHNLYECVKCTMDMSKAGDVSFMSWSSYDNLLQSEETTRLHASNDSLSNGETTKQREEDSYLHRGVVNTEIFIVPDEKFFQYCCQYLFTQTSLFLLTFSGSKVLNYADGEILRLQNLIHSIRCCVGYDSNILTYGLVGPHEQADFGSSIKDQVQTLFYTSKGQQIRKYSVTIPDLILQSVEDNVTSDSSKILKQNVWRAVSETMHRQHVSVLSVVMMHQLEDMRREGKQVVTEEEFTKLFKMSVPNGEPSLQHVVWTHLKEFGEILSLKAAPLNIPDNQQMEKLIFIDPEIIVHHVQSLICIPQRYASSTDVVKQIWFKLVATGNISREDILTVIESHSLGAEKILSLLLGFGLIFKHYVDQDGVEQYFFPYFLSDQGTLESQKVESSDPCLYLQFVDQTHMSSMQFYQLAFSLCNHSDDKKISLSSAGTCTIHHLGHEISLVHHKFDDRMQIAVSKSERNKKLFCVYQWLSEICNSTLAPEIQYVLGPECPLQHNCEVKGSTSNIHVLELLQGAPISCNTTRIDNDRSVRRWLQDQGPENYEQKSKCYIKDLPYTIFFKLYTLLQIQTTLGQDWRGLGGLLGLSIQDIALYETQKDPAKVLLLDQDQTRRLTVPELIELLDHSDMKRKDLIELLQDWLDSKK